MKRAEARKISRMLARAQRISRERESKAGLDKETHTEEANAPCSPLDPNSYEVFKKVNGGTRLLLAEPAVWIAFIFIFFFLFYVRPGLLPACIALFGLAQAIQIVVNRVRYQRFIGWHTRLPYALHGWEELVQAKRMYADLCWTDLLIRVDIESGSKTCVEYVGASLSVFCERAGKAFYSRKAGSGDRRKKWVLLSDLSAQGSANTGVMRYLKRLLDSDLAMLARSDECIITVWLEQQSEEYEVPIEIRSSEGST
jgi:hypothetical protein